MNMAVPARRRASREAEHPSAHLQLLGGFELVCDGEAASLPLGAQRLIAFLAIRRQRLLRAHVAGALWLELPDSRAGANLRSSLWRLNCMDRHLVEASPTSLRLSDSVSVDLWEAERSAYHVLRGDARTEDVDDLEVRVLVLDHELLPDWYEEWMVYEQQRFHQLRLHALETLCLRLTAARRFAQAIDAGQRAVAAEPLRETAHRALILAHLEEGNRSEAVKHYRRFAERLHDELGCHPSESMERLVAPLAM
ncbi:MAG TPA: BTAD domain-containing putative transcriptional regulator [Acidimicrobiales bacterium]|nr:BTAD domain-containing putative transcriptional regulator [Acidimicrobiales bacterium]